MTRDDYPAVVAEHNDLYVHLLQRRVVALQEQSVVQAKLESLDAEIKSLEHDIQALAVRLPPDPDERVLDQLAEDFEFMCAMRHEDEINVDPADDCPF